MSAKRFIALWGSGLVMVVCALISAGCPSANTASVSDVVGEDVTAILDDLNNTVVIRVVNLTGLVVELDVKVDGLPQTLRCPQINAEISQEICDFPQTECPIRIEATELRLLGSDGGFAGGETYFGNEGFSFVKGEDYDCGQFIMYRFTADSSEAFVVQ